MKSLFKAGAAFLVLGLAACGGSGGNNATASLAPPNGPVANVAAPNGGDWTQTVSQTERGFLMGNPNAPVKLVEYASITCPHCAEFTVDGGAEGIQSYVRSGRVSWEYRPYALFPTDPGLFALLRCQGADAFFPLTEQLYADQNNWRNRGQTWLEANREQFGQMSEQAKAAALVPASGVDAFFRQRGMTQPQIDQCLANVANIERIGVDTNHASQTDNVTGTPTFFINGMVQEGVGLWSVLEPRLRQAVGG